MLQEFNWFLESPLLQATLLLLVEHPFILLTSLKLVVEVQARTTCSRWRHDTLLWWVEIKHSPCLCLSLYLKCFSWYALRQWCDSLQCPIMSSWCSPLLPQVFCYFSLITCEKMFDQFRLILVFVGVIGVFEGPFGGITHVLGTLER